MPNKVVKLDKPITGHTVIRQLEFREPKFRDVMELGDPFVWVPAGEYHRRVDDMPTIARYAERLYVEGDKAGDPLILDELGLRDTRKVREAIIDFFREGEAESVASNTSPETSSSTPASTPDRSAA
ncbi:hypothetical protein [Methylobacterium radiodurans]|uniref:Uncharacterized protein n=1 Tax=Methylobacterium radiodurans TaxID=2202828 RepID=A0A2U8VSW1_9HYPH|nr:hypothetical protein [Methylobacterium radiodurans]AWN36531.1 hypothetical protein DK427_12985 [Methylobacterium radiodurans]